MLRGGKRDIGTKDINCCQEICTWFPISLWHSAHSYIPSSLSPFLFHLPFYIYMYIPLPILCLFVSLSLSFLHFSLSSAILHFTVNPLFSMEYMVDYIKSLCNDYIQHVAHLVLRFRPVYVSKMYVTDSLKYYYVAGT